MTRFADAFISDRVVEALGPKIRRQRRRMGLTLQELALRSGISKPYLSLIETGAVSNPPSDEKVQRLEKALAFAPGELLLQAHISRTPRDVRAVLLKLAGKARADGAGGGSDATATESPGIDLDSALLAGTLHQLVEHSRGNVEQVATNAVPIINKVAAGYPTDFGDLSYPRGLADSFVSCPDLADPDAFAARVHGDSMTPKYRPGDIVIFSPRAPVKDGCDCFIRFDDARTTFKRIFFETDDAGSAAIRLQPRNECYRSQTIPADQITGLWRAVFKYQSVDEA